VAASWTFIGAWQRPDAPGRWYTDPELVLTVIPNTREEQLAVVIDLRFDDDGPYVTGLTVRKHPRAGYRGERTNVSPRDVQRLPLAAYVRAALAFASTAEKPPLPRAHPEEAALGIPDPRPFDPRVESDRVVEVGAAAEELLERGFEVSQAALAAGAALAPPEMPPRGKKPPLKWVADQHRLYSKTPGLSPAKEIAAALDVPLNRVHQWIHEARKKGYLEPSPSSRRR
jgi:hypothetical protein